MSRQDDAEYRKRERRLAKKAATRPSHRDKYADVQQERQAGAFAASLADLADTLNGRRLDNVSP